MAVFYLFLWGMGTGNSDRNIKAAEICQPWSRKRTFLCYLWIDGDMYVHRSAGVDRFLAVCFCCDLCYDCRVDQRSFDREGVWRTLVGLFRQEMESGRLHLSDGICGLGSYGICGSPLGQLPASDPDLSASGLIDEDCAVSPCGSPVCGCYGILSIVDRKKPLPGEVGGGRAESGQGRCQI